MCWCPYHLIESSVVFAVPSLTPRRAFGTAQTVLFAETCGHLNFDSRINMYVFFVPSCTVHTIVRQPNSLDLLVPLTPFTLPRSRRHRWDKALTNSAEFVCLSPPGAPVRWFTLCAKVRPPSAVISHSLTALYCAKCVHRVSTQAQHHLPHVWVEYVWDRVGFVDAKRCDSLVWRQHQLSLAARTLHIVAFRSPTCADVRRGRSEHACAGAADRIECTVPCSCCLRGSCGARVQPPGKYHHTSSHTQRLSWAARCDSSISLTNPPGCCMLSRISPTARRCDY